MISILWLVAVLSARQDVDEWIRQLAADEVLVRGEAADALVRLWETDAVSKRVAKVEKGSADDQTKLQARSILDRIALRRTLGKPFVESIGNVDRLFEPGEHQLPASFPKWLHDPASVGLQDPERQRIAVGAAISRLTSEEAKCRSLIVMSNRVGPKHPPALWAAAAAPLLKDASPRVRVTASWVLGKSKLKDLENGLAELLSDSTEGHLAYGRDGSLHWMTTKRPVCSVAAEALGEIGATGSAGRIALLLKHPHPAARRAAATALGTLRAKEFTERIGELLEDGDEQIRATAAWELGQLGAKAYSKRIAGLLGSESWYENFHALWALAYLNAQDQVAAIRPFLKDENVDLRCQAALVLARMGRKECADEIAALLTDEEACTAPSAVVALRVLGAKDQARSMKRAALERSERLGTFEVPAELPTERTGRNVSLAQFVDEVLRGWGIDPKSLKD